MRILYLVLFSLLCVCCGVDTAAPRPDGAIAPSVQLMSVSCAAPADATGWIVLNDFTLSGSDASETLALSPQCQQPATIWITLQPSNR
jgi:hypothetical protein